MNTAVLFSSATDEWSTPQDFFVLAEFDFGPFDVDLAASAENTKCRRYYSAEDSALTHDWGAEFPHGKGWCNPPYSRGLQGKFIAKAAYERMAGFTTAMLIPARTDTKAFHTHIYDYMRWSARPGVEIRLLPGRLKFGGAANSAPFPSMLVIFRGDRKG